MKTVYLCGGINGLSDDEAKAWRGKAKAALSGLFLASDPMDRDYRGREAENVHAIVGGDLQDIYAADVLLVRADRPSWGTAMEVFHAFRSGKVVVAFGAGPRPSPWLAAHCHHLAADLDGALDYLRTVHAPG